MSDPVLCIILLVLIFWVTAPYIIRYHAYMDRKIKNVYAESDEILKPELEKLKAKREELRDIYQSMKDRERHR